MILPKSISFESIKNDLTTFIENKPELASWLDRLDSGLGTTIIELLAGLGSMKAYHEYMRRRENNLDSALLLSSVMENTFKKGFLVSPTFTGEISVVLQRKNTDVIINLGEQIGFIEEYGVYSMENKTIDEDNPTATILCAVGIMDEFDIPSASINSFKKFEFDLSKKYAASQLEKFIADGVEIPLESDMPSVTITNNFLLRRMVQDKVKIYTGNNNLGWCNTEAQLVKYQVLSYDERLSSFMGLEPTILFNLDLVSSTIIRNPEYIDRDKLKYISLYYPLDGRIVIDRDYEALILKFFSTVVDDVYSYNSDPDQEVYIIKGLQWTEDNATEIANKVDSQRALGMQVIYHLDLRSSGKELTCTFRVASSNFYVGLTNDINTYLEKFLFKYARENKTYTTSEFAVMLSVELGIEIHPRPNTDLSPDYVDLLPTEFLKQINVIIELA